MSVDTLGDAALSKRIRHPGRSVYQENREAGPYHRALLRSLASRPAVLPIIVLDQYKPKPAFERKVSSWPRDNESGLRRKPPVEHQVSPRLGDKTRHHANMVSPGALSYFACSR